MGEYTPNIGLYKPSVKENGWQTKVNLNWDKIDKIVSDVDSDIQANAAWANGAQMVIKTPGGTYIPDQYVSNSAGSGNHPHAVDIYLPPGEIKRAIILLHGGGSNKVQFSRLLGLSLATPIQNSNIRWDILDAWNCMAFIPQGQACTGVVNANNPNGVDTRSASYPEGVRTWSNRQMWSQADDVQFLKDLSNFITSNYGNIGKNLCGHSQGGMMVSRMWYEAPSYFNNFCSASAGGGKYYIDNPALPSVIKPFVQVIGQKDTVLNVENGPNGVGNHFYEDLWKQGASTESIADVYTPLEYIGAWKHLKTAVDAYTSVHGFPVVVPAQGDAIETTIRIGTQKQWTYQNDHVSVIWLSDADHSVTSIQDCMAKHLIGVWLNFVISSTF